MREGLVLARRREVSANRRRPEVIGEPQYRRECPKGDKGSSNKPLLRSPLFKSLFPDCLNGEPQPDHHDESTCARDNIFIEFEKISGCLDQSNRSNTYRDVNV
jgi:hypothetical protein